MRIYIAVITLFLPDFEDISCHFFLLFALEEVKIPVMEKVLANVFAVVFS